MAAANLSSEQLEKLKAALAKAKGLPPAASVTASKVGEVLQAAVQELPEEENKPRIETKLAEGTYLRVEDDDMTAWLYLAPPEEGQVYTKRELEDYLELNGVIKGFHSSNLSAMVKKKVYDREILVAKGQEAVPGQDGYFEYLFSPEEHVGPVIRDDGTVDYSSMSALQNVHKGDKVAVYHYAVPGVDGYTVRGTVLKATLARDLPPMRGKGITRENGVYYALNDGKIEVKDGKIDIQNVHEIIGDVDAITGKIEFFGDVIINGNVDGGVTIRAGRNIEIHGTTGGASVFAGGDVLLPRGI